MDVRAARVVVQTTRPAVHVIDLLIVVRAWAAGRACDDLVVPIAITGCGIAVRRRSMLSVSHLWHRRLIGDDAEYPTFVAGKAQRLLPQLGLQGGYEPTVLIGISQPRGGDESIRWSCVRPSLG